MDAMAILEELSFYTEAPPELKRQIADAASHAHLDARQPFYRAGEENPVFALVGHGDIRRRRAIAP
jgi:hypothetical protein